jgi:hypothetical protein
MTNDKPRGKKEYVSIESILNNPSDKSKLIAFLDEAVIHKKKIEMENEGITDLRNDAVEAMGLSPKLFNQLLRVTFKNSYTETKAEISALESAIEMLFDTGE